MTLVLRRRDVIPLCKIDQPIKILGALPHPAELLALRADRFHDGRSHDFDFLIRARVSFIISSRRSFFVFFECLSFASADIAFDRSCFESAAHRRAFAAEIALLMRLTLHEKIGARNGACG